MLESNGAVKLTPIAAVPALKDCVKLDDTATLLAYRFMLDKVGATRDVPIIAVPALKFSVKLDVV